MAIAISSQMASSLVALTTINDDVGKTQNRLATGLAVASAADNISVYFKAQSYTTKAEDLSTTNKNISQAVANLDVVDKAITNMQEGLKGAVQLMKDARAKAVTVQKAGFVAGDTAYETKTVGTGATARTLKGNIVQPKALNAGDTATSADSSSFFQVGDVFGVTLKDATGAPVTKYFRAADPTKDLPTKAVNANGEFVTTNGATTVGGAPITEANAATANGATYNQAMNFNDLASLKDAIQSAFGYDNVTMNLNTTGTGDATTYKLGFQLANVNQSLSFFQANDQAVGNGTATDPGAAFDFRALFGNLQNAVGSAFGTAPTPTSDRMTFLNGQVSTAVTGSLTYGAVGGAANNADVAIQARLDAANFYKQTLAGLDNLVKDAALPGYANVLKGEQMIVNLNETGDVRQVIQLTQKADPLSLGIAGYAVNAQGSVTTTATADDFRTDLNLDNAIAQSNNAVALLKQIQTILSAAKVAMNSRLDFNKTVVTTLANGATSMTAADTNAEAANLAALQNRQAFAINNMSTTKQSEQSLIQLLR